MESQKKLNQLIANEEFQDDILYIKDSSSEALLEKYSISEKELVYAKKLMACFNFKKEETNNKEIQYALKKLLSKISVIQNRKKTKLVTWIIRAAAILAIPLLISTIYFYHNSSKSIVLSENTVMNTVFAPIGSRTQVPLPDGSLVWLNSGSQLSYPTVFDSDCRRIKIKGEAYFQVVKNEKTPMLVSTNQLGVKVYGTEFNVSAFENNKTIDVTLVNGKITIIPSKDKNHEYIIKPGYTASYNIQQNKLNLQPVENMDRYIGWKDGKLLFNNEKFNDIIKKLERYYNVDIQLTDPSLGGYVLYATFVDENIEQVLEVISNSIPIITEYPQRIKQADGNYSKRKIIIKRNMNKTM